MCSCTQYTCLSQRTTWFHPLNRWGPGIELRPSGLVETPLSTKLSCCSPYSQLYNSVKTHTLSLCVVKKKKNNLLFHLFIPFPNPTFSKLLKIWFCIIFQFSEQYAFSFPVAFNDYITIWNHFVIINTEQATHLYLIHSKWFISLSLACFRNLSKFNIIWDRVCP